MKKTRYHDMLRDNIPVTLRITDSCEGRAEAPTTRSRAFHLKSGEARVSSDAIAGMLSFIFFVTYYPYIYVLCNHMFVCVRHYFWFSSLLLPS